MNAMLDNTVNAWRQAFGETKEIEMAWERTQEILAKRNQIGITNKEEFISELRQNKQEILTKYFVIAELNTLINDTETIEKNISLVLNKGYTYVSEHDTYKKTLSNNNEVFVSLYMINTHTNIFLETVINQLEKEAC